MVVTSDASVPWSGSHGVGSHRSVGVTAAYYLVCVYRQLGTLLCRLDAALWLERRRARLPKMCPFDNPRPA
ncbi:TPA: hypothetical protein EYM82_08065, partial [Candidatus Poribacteria bacterium]|nr:hypothetical protein [Candidatus Poribacteria bacterium]